LKLCRWGEAGAERPGIIDSNGDARDLSGVVRSLESAQLTPGRLAQLGALDCASLPRVPATQRRGVPYEGMSKFVCIGLNYRDHAQEAGLAIPSEPVIFLKAPSALCGPEDDTMQPQYCTKLDWEVELGVVIGTKARNVSEQDALRHVAGYCVVNDVSERAFQLQSSQWDKGKGCDTFGPVGPWLVTTDELPDPQNLSLWLDVNGTRMQSGSTANMIFPVRTLIAYVSRYMTLLPGDLIATGTPAGVGMGHKPSPLWLQPGDRVELGIEGLGRQSHRVVPFAA
jgi:2-keto-4-pentenoate hydratase/2-oxohepta-3-ene-1,7-dioic acid hydratase in catechol pathway